MNNNMQDKQSPVFPNVHRRLFGLFSPQRSLLFRTVANTFATALAIVFQAYLLSVIIDGVFLKGAGFESLHLPMYAFAAVALLRAGLHWHGEITAQAAPAAIKAELRDNLVSHLTDLGPSYTKGEHTGELVSIATAGIEKLDDYFARYVPSAIGVCIVPVCILLFVFGIDPLSGLILLITGPLIPVFMWLIGVQAEKKTRRQWTLMSVLSSHFLDTLQGLKTLKLFGRSGARTLEIVSISDRFRRATMDVLKVAFLSGMVLELAASISTALVAVQIGIRLIEGMITFQPGLFVLLLAPEFYLPFRLLGTHHHAGMEGAAAAGRLFEVLDTKSTVPSAHSVFPLRFENIEILARDLTYTYPGESAPALRGFHCSLYPGTVTALVGRSGSGKTTLLNIMLRYLGGYEGTVSVNGTLLDSISPHAWRSHISLVPQSPHFFDATVRDNISIGRPGADPAGIIEAACRAEAHDFISGLPDGYDTMLGENGARLSGGERQRLALARAFLRDAPFVILDEPTSNLDPDSEAKIIRAMEDLMREKTVLIVAHRLTTVRRADSILVLSGGTVIEHGTHNELISLGGEYHGMVRQYE